MYAQLPDDLVCSVCGEQATTLIGDVAYCRVHLHPRAKVKVIKMHTKNGTKE